MMVSGLLKTIPNYEWDVLTTCVVKWSGNFFTPFAHLDAFYCNVKTMGPHVFEAIQDTGKTHLIDDDQVLPCYSSRDQFVHHQTRGSYKKLD